MATVFYLRQQIFDGRLSADQAFGNGIVREGQEFLSRVSEAVRPILHALNVIGGALEIKDRALAIRMIENVESAPSFGNALAVLKPTTSTALTRAFARLRATGFVVEPEEIKTLFSLVEADRQVYVKKRLRMLNERLVHRFGPTANMIPDDE